MLDKPSQRWLFAPPLCACAAPSRSAHAKAAVAQAKEAKRAWPLQN